uniref:Olfactomedin-like domain-containing protein n=1 Tax=Piliocolobus tephrosceles TaxID=591936 RepID=A0A8C9LML1_9PRIM
MQPAIALLTTPQLLPLVLPGESQLVRSMSSSVDEGGTCHCVVHLPNNPIPLEQLEQLQSTVQELICKYEQKLEYAHTIEDKDNEVLEMSHMPESWNPSALASPYENPAFNLLRLELEGAQELAIQLKAIGGIIVTNASVTLKLLADSYQRSFGALQQEVDVLESQLSEWEREKEKEQASRHLDHPSPWVTSCAHGGLQEVSKPLVVQLNWRGFSYKAGLLRSPNNSKCRAWPRYFDYYWLYKSYNDLVLLKNYGQRKTGYGDGSENVVYKNFMYFNYYGTSNTTKMDLSSNTLVLRHPLPGATYNNHFSCAGVPWKELDFVGDEKGLWVLYATEDSKGNLVVSRLNTSTLEPALSGAFMVCGVLYALRSLKNHLLRYILCL